MSIKQLSVFIPNKNGSLAEITGIFAKEGFDVRAISVYDTAEYGILRAIVDDPQRASDVLQSYGVVTKLSDILAFNPEDTKGTLHNAFQLLSSNGIAIEYVYSFVAYREGPQYFGIKVDDIKRAEAILKNNGIQVINNY